EHIDTWILRQSDRIVNAAEPGDIGARIPPMLERRYCDDVDGPPGTGGDGIAVLGKKLQQAAADSADTGQSDLQSVTHGKVQNVLFALEAMGMTLCIVFADSERNLRILRAAWRMRCSFSTRAMRT